MNEPATIQALTGKRPQWNALLAILVRQANQPGATEDHAKARDGLQKKLTETTGELVTVRLPELSWEFLIQQALVVQDNRLVYWMVSNRKAVKVDQQPDPEAAKVRKAIETAEREDGPVESWPAMCGEATPKPTRRERLAERPRLF